MKITALEEYGLRCMLLLARQPAGASLTLPEIAAREGLSIPYAGKLLMILKQAGLVKAARGRKGGYVLARPDNQIHLSEIFGCLGDSVFTKTYCLQHSGGSENCVHMNNCDVKKIWTGIDRFFASVFSRVTLAELASGKIDMFESLASGSSDFGEIAGSGTANKR